MKIRAGKRYNQHPSVDKFQRIYCVKWSNGRLEIKKNYLQLLFQYLAANFGESIVSESWSREPSNEMERNEGNEKGMDLSESGERNGGTETEERWNEERRFCMYFIPQR